MYDYLPLAAQTYASTAFHLFGFSISAPEKLDNTLTFASTRRQIYGIAASIRAIRRLILAYDHVIYASASRMDVMMHFASRYGARHRVTTSRAAPLYAAILYLFHFYLLL